MSTTGKPADPVGARLMAIAGTDSELLGYLEANRDAIVRTLIGKGPDSTSREADAGAHAVVNIACTHIPAFATDKGPTPYKNYYDLGKAGPSRVGEQLPTRQIVDQSLPLGSVGPEDVYFAAAEVNGSGIRFYGDVCLVLKDSSVASDTVILDRNSYDLVRLPLRTEIDAAPDPDAKRCDVAKDISGRWDADLADMCCVKMLDSFDRRRRRLTTGEISTGLLCDEDYIEVLWVRNPHDGHMSFGPDDILEVRLNAADVAAEERIMERSRSGPPAAMHELAWMHRRRAAERALNAQHIRVMVVTTTGRARA
jgi:hypothetical protein